MEKPVIFLLGVAHVLKVKDFIKDEIISIAPRAVCVELDRGRLYALQHPQEISYKGLPLYLRLLARLQRKLGESYGVRAGEEMLAAVESAKMLNAPVFLVDDDAYQSLRKMFKEMTLKEKMRFFTALLPLPSLRKKTTIEKELEKYEKDESSYIQEFSRYFPTAKRILIDERNQHMAERIYRVGEKYGRVVAVLGDAHLEGIKEMLVKKGADVEVVHLKDLGGRVKISVVYRHA